MCEDCDALKVSLAEISARADRFMDLAGQRGVELAKAQIATKQAEKSWMASDRMAGIYHEQLCNIAEQLGLEDAFVDGEDVPDAISSAIDEAATQIEELTADNAAIIEMLDRTEEYVPKDSMEYGDAVMTLSQPHPGQSLLDAHKAEIEKLTADNAALLTACRKASHRWGAGCGEAPGCGACVCCLYDKTHSGQAFLMDLEELKVKLDMEILATGMLVGARDHWKQEAEVAQADNAALLDALSIAYTALPVAKIRDENQAELVRVRGIIKDALSQPHPGQALLREIDDRREKMQASYQTGANDEVTVYGTNADIDGLQSYFHRLVIEREAARKVVEAARTCREESEMIDETEGNVGGYCYIDGVTVLEDALDAYDAVKEAGDA